MKVLHVIPNLLKGGAQRLVIDIFNEFKKNNKLECKLLVLGESKNEFSHFSSGLDIVFCKVTFQLSILKKIGLKSALMKISLVNLNLILFIAIFTLPNWFVMKDQEKI